MRQLQKFCLPWLYGIFGAKAYSKVNRTARFLEEALEMVQAVGLDKTSVLDLVDYVYSRPVGEPEQELGGVMLSAMSLAEVLGLDAENAADVELIRCLEFDEDKRAKMRDKVRPAARLAA